MGVSSRSPACVRTRSPGRRREHTVGHARPGGTSNMPRFARGRSRFRRLFQRGSLGGCSAARDFPSSTRSAAARLHDLLANPALSYPAQVEAATHRGSRRSRRPRARRPRPSSPSACTRRSLVHQREVGPDTLSFASALTRSRPASGSRIILIGEMRDAETTRRPPRQAPRVRTAHAGRAADDRPHHRCLPAPPAGPPVSSALQGIASPWRAGPARRRVPRTDRKNTSGPRRRGNTWTRANDELLRLLQGHACPAQPPTRSRKRSRRSLGQRAQ